MNFDTNRHAVVCGSTQGIGLASARKLAESGAQISLIARNESALAAIAKELPNGPHAYFTADFNEPARIVEELPGFLASRPPVSILVNNTGGPPGGQVVEARAEEFLAAFNAHLLCNHALVRAVLPGMKQQRFGRIINIISTSVKQPIPGLGVSNTIRGAVASWAKTLAGEVGQFGITVNNVLPGATDTQRLKSIIKNKAEKAGRSVDEVAAEMSAEIPLRRFASAEEIANVVAFLASEAASYVSGVNIPVDGGRTLAL